MPPAGAARARCCPLPRAAGRSRWAAAICCERRDDLGPRRGRLAGGTVDVQQQVLARGDELVVGVAPAARATGAGAWRRVRAAGWRRRAARRRGPRRGGGCGSRPCSRSARRRCRARRCRSRAGRRRWCRPSPRGSGTRSCGRCSRSTRARRAASCSRRRPSGSGGLRAGSPGALVQLALGERHHLAGAEAGALQPRSDGDQAVVADAVQLGDRAPVGLGV